MLELKFAHAFGTPQWPQRKKDRPQNAELSPIQFGAHGRSLFIFSLCDTPSQIRAR
jgi:hypothetical protein